MDDTIYAIGGRDGSGDRTTNVYESIFCFGINPPQGRTVGGDTVTITGDPLGNGGDITNVYLCGIPMAAIVSQSATQVVVTTAASASGLTGDVVVCWVSFGTTVRSNAFHYMAAYVIRTSQNGPGILSPSGQVFVSIGGDTCIVVRADAYYHYYISELLTNGVLDKAATGLPVYSSLWSNVGGDGIVTVSFVEDRTEGGTSHWWLAHFGLTNDGQSFDQAETNDPDADHYSSRQEYIADTCPTNASSCFIIQDLTCSNSAAILFSCTNSRCYSLFYATNLLDGFFQPVAGQTNLPGEASGSMTLRHTGTTATVQSYRIRVNMP